MRPSRPLAPFRPLALVLAAPLVGLGCQSAAPAPEAEPYHGQLAQKREPEPIGFFLAEMDTRLRAWSNYKLTGTSRRDERTLRMLEQELRQKTGQRFDDLREQVESGPPKNRAIAAMAIGFSDREEALSPLLACLDEDDPELVGNALIGLGILARPDTPVAQICHLLTYHLDPFTRGNAAFCLQRLVSAGVEDDCVRTSCRDALLDEEPGVRAQAATILGLLEDSDSTEEVALLLGDQEPLVVSAAAHALATVGRADPHVKGACARALVKSLDDLPSRVRQRVLFELALLADRNYGDDEEAWRDWAFRLD